MFFDGICVGFMCFFCVFLCFLAETSRIVSTFFMFFDRNLEKREHFFDDIDVGFNAFL